MDPKRVDEELDGLFDEIDALLKNVDVLAALTDRGVNASLAMTAADGLARLREGGEGEGRGGLRARRGGDRAVGSTRPRSWRSRSRRERRHPHPSPLSGAAYSAVELMPGERSPSGCSSSGSFRGLEHYVEMTRVEEVAEGIRALAVRGAPAIGISAAYGWCSRARVEGGLCAGDERGRRAPARDPPDGGEPGLGARSDGAGRRGDRARSRREPRRAARGGGARDPSRGRRRVPRDGGDRRARVPRRRDHPHPLQRRRARHGRLRHRARRHPRRARGRASASASSRARRGPYLQGARLTAWELHRDGIPVDAHHRLDGRAAHARGGRSTSSSSGADRIARTGDVANKIGTYGVACLAHLHGVPFYVAAPWSTVDLACPTATRSPSRSGARAR